MIIYTDGAYKPSLKQGGVGVVWIQDDKIIKTYNKGYKNVSNQKMELCAVIVALRYIIKNNIHLDKLEIVSDSMYAIGCASMGWKKKKNIKLRNLLDESLEECQKLVDSEITFRWTKGHDSDIYNNMADELADKASKEFLG